ncbi:MAG: energy transducer TonB [Xanthomonadales bacterium]|nr:TonB family protein [Gammaproteobacteria bacterium]MBT8054283.1 TonB family protein [Gammaproteobacteria bacterium]NND57524.1 energy transducer TonB [Xanthomonadales bacterium]NNK51248.1 energy transducer TonB [Xanthomonadales bacterium]
MLKSAPYTSWTQDRFMLFLVLAVALHAVLLFGIHFGVSLNPLPRLADTLDVVLVQWRSESEPEQADYLAQASQKGGGETTEKVRPSEEVSGQLPVPSEGQDMQQAAAQTPAPEVDVREIIALENAAEPSLLPTAVEQPESEQPNASDLMQQSMEMASLQPEVSRQRQWKSSLPRREFISANTRKYEFASYMSAWVSKVERIGNMNYPTELRRKKLHGDLILTVGIHQNGTVESIDVKRSSGFTEIDQAAIRIVQLAAPYSPLPDNIREHVDVLHITRTWRFETGFGVE